MTSVVSRSPLLCGHSCADRAGDADQVLGVNWPSGRAAVESTAVRAPIALALVLRGLDVMVRIACWVVFLATAFAVGSLIPAMVAFLRSGGS
jgi:hypothetical protein